MLQKNRTLRSQNCGNLPGVILTSGAMCLRLACWVINAHGSIQNGSVGAWFVSAVYKLTMLACRGLISIHTLRRSGRISFAAKSLEQTLGRQSRMDYALNNAHQ